MGSFDYLLCCFSLVYRIKRYKEAKRNYHDSYILGKLWKVDDQLKQRINVERLNSTYFVMGDVNQITYRKFR